MQWNREEYIAHMNHENIGKEMFCELFGLLLGLDTEWKKQGALAAELDLSAFGWDYVLKTNVDANCSVKSGIQSKILEDTPEIQISQDSYGRKMKLIKNSATIPLPMEYPVKNADDWIKIKHWYAFDEKRVNREKLLETKKLQEQGYLVCGYIPGGFDEPRQLMGEEELCVAFYDQPELIKDILSTISDTCLKVFERVTDIVSIDCLCIHEDMAGKSGPLAGPNQIREFFKPYYKSVWDELLRSGSKIFSQDSDGNMNAVVDSFIDCGVTCMYPCEPAAGMDIVKLSEKYGNRISFKGGIDKFALRGTKEDIRKELEYKLTGVTLGGGNIFALDHRIPNGVPLENYRYYVKLGREILGLPKSEECPHVRMAF